MACSSCRVDRPRIRIVLDNLSTHTPAALYQAPPPAQARRILQRVEFHYTPKHASWLNMVEIEIGMLRSQCLDRRIECSDRLIAEVAAWEQLRNASGRSHQLDVLYRNGPGKIGQSLPSTDL